MMGNGIISGALLSWIAIITELATGILLYNYRTTTLTIEIFTAVLRGNYGIAAAMACILTVMTTISLLLFMKISKTRTSHSDARAASPAPNRRSGRNDR